MPLVITLLHIKNKTGGKKSSHQLHAMLLDSPEFPSIIDSVLIMHIGCYSLPTVAHMVQSGTHMKCITSFEVLLLNLLFVAEEISK